MLRKMLRKTTVLCGWNGCAVRLGAMAEVPGQWPDNIDRATALAMLHRSLRVAHRTDRAIWGGIASQRIMARPNRAPFVIRYSASSSGTTCSRDYPRARSPMALLMTQSCRRSGKMVARRARILVSRPTR